MLAATNAMVAEFSNLKNRSLCVTIMAAGYPMGAIVGGSIASLLLTEFHWRAIFIFGGAVTALSIPLVLALLPESVYFLEARRPKKALDKINAVLKRLGRQAVSALPDLTADTTPKAGLSTLFGPRLISITLILTLAYFFHIMTFYFILKWIPKIVVDMGFAAPLAGGVLVWANVGGAMGAVLLGILSQRFGVKGLVIGAMVLGAIMVAVFGRGQDDLQQLSLIAAIAGFCTNAGVVGLYALFAQGFPTEVRAGGTGFAIGVGRGGAALGPIIAGLLFEAGASLQLVAIIMGSGSLMAAIALLFLRLNRTPDAVLSDADKSAACSRHPDHRDVPFRTRAVGPGRSSVRGRTAFLVHRHAGNAVGRPVAWAGDAPSSLKTHKAESRHPLDWPSGFREAGDGSVADSTEMGGRPLVAGQSGRRCGPSAGSRHSFRLTCTGDRSGRARLPAGNRASGSYSR